MMINTKTIRARRVAHRERAAAAFAQDTALVAEWWAMLETSHVRALWEASPHGLLLADLAECRTQHGLSWITTSQLRRVLRGCSEWFVRARFGNVYAVCLLLGLSLPRTGVQGTIARMQWPRSLIASCATCQRWFEPRSPRQAMRDVTTYCSKACVPRRSAQTLRHVPQRSTPDDVVWAWLMALPSARRHKDAAA